MGSVATVAAAKKRAGGEGGGGVGGGGAPPPRPASTSGRVYGPRSRRVARATAVATEKRRTNATSACTTGVYHKGRRAPPPRAARLRSRLTVGDDRWAVTRLVAPSSNALRGERSPA